MMLSPIEQRVYLLGVQPAETARMLGITRNYAKQIALRVRKKLAQPETPRKIYPGCHCVWSLGDPPRFFATPRGAIDDICARLEAVRPDWRSPKIWLGSAGLQAREASAARRALQQMFGNLRGPTCKITANGGFTWPTMREAALAEGVNLSSISARVARTIDSKGTLWL